MTSSEEMDAKVFTTEKIARLLFLPEWRVVRFAQVKDYRITPHYGVAAGPGSRRLYSLENVCEIALAWWLLQAGLQVKAIGHVLEHVRSQGGLNHFVTSLKHIDTYMGVIRTSQGKKVMQDVAYIHDWEQLKKIFAHSQFGNVLVIPVGLNFAILQKMIEKAKG
jgi:DNA-binding transcriptional MerR regulator